MMTMKNLWIALSVVITSLVALPGIGQNLLQNPEHIAWDPLHQRYLVTNYGNGTVVSIDKNDTRQVVLTGLTNCMGIHIQDTMLMISYGKKIRFLDLNTLRQFREVTLNTSTWLDGMITDNQHNVYVIESGGKIFKVNMDTYETTTIVTSGIPQYAQDMAFDPVNNRLIVVAWQVNSAIKAVDLASYAVTTLQTTQLGNFDGVARDSLGNLYVSCHRNGGKVYRFDSSFQQAPAVIYSGLISPAGLCLNEADNELAIPDFDGNTVTFVSGIYSGIENCERISPDKIRIYGNELIMDFSEPCLSVTFYSVDGRVVYSCLPTGSINRIDLNLMKSRYPDQILIFSILTNHSRLSGKIILRD
jgi:DNA-binding beta-propeller fold protein YncE